MRFLQITFTVALLSFSLASQAQQSTVAQSVSVKNFVYGFIEGALLTDEAIMKASEKTQPNSKFMQRVYDTRLSTKTDVPYTYYADFCLPSTQSKEFVIQSVIEALDAQSLEPNGLNVYNALKHRFPCLKR